MKKLGLMVAGATMFLAVAGFTACSFDSNGTTVNGNLSYVQDDLLEKSFKEIDVEMVADVYYTQNDGDECSVRLDYSAIKDEKFLKELKEKLKVVYREDKVVIGCKGSIKVPVSCMSKDVKLKIYITSPDLVKVSQEGAGNFHAKVINSDRFAIDNEGVGSVYIGKILANKVTVANEGVGSVNIDDVAGDNMTVDNEGVGSVKITNVSMGSLKVDNEGVGSVNLGFFKGGSLNILNEGVGSVKAKVDCQSVHATSEGVGGINLSGVTRQYSKKKDGVGGISDSGLTVRK